MSFHSRFFRRFFKSSERFFGVDSFIFFEAKSAVCWLVLFRKDFSLLVSQDFFPTFNEEGLILGRKLGGKKSFWKSINLSLLGHPQPKMEGGNAGEKIPGQRDRNHVFVS